MDRNFWRYLLWQLPGWLVAALALAWLDALLGLPLWVAAGLLALWIGKDLALFPLLRRAFQPASAGLVGACGHAVEALAPTGYVQVAGELWRAEAARPGAAIVAGRPVVVRERRGLTLVVEEAPGGAGRPAAGA